MTTLTVTRIWRCNATECVHNVNMKCRAPAIGIGGPDPLCENVSYSQPSGGEVGQGGGEIGACAAGTCIFNEGGHCAARAIHVVAGRSLPVCGTYRDTSYLDERG